MLGFFYINVRFIVTSDIVKINKLAKLLVYEVWGLKSFNFKSECKFKKFFNNVIKYQRL